MGMPEKAVPIRRTDSAWAATEDLIQAALAAPTEES